VEVVVLLMETTGQVLAELVEVEMVKLQQQQMQLERQILAEEEVVVVVHIIGDGGSGSYYNCVMQSIQTTTGVQQLQSSGE
jgi:hypothetical protein